MSQRMEQYRAGKAKRKRQGKPQRGERMKKAGSKKWAGLQCPWANGVCALVLLPLFTLLLGSHGSPVEDSLSAIGNRTGMRPLFLLWTAAVCFCFSGTIAGAAAQIENRRAQMAKALARLGCALLFLSSLVPFAPEASGAAGALHSGGAMAAVLLLLLAAVLLTHSLRVKTPAFFRLASRTLAALLIFLAALYACFQTKWITEAAAVWGGSAYVFFLQLGLQKNRHEKTQQPAKAWEEETGSVRRPAKE